MFKATVDGKEITLEFGDIVKTREGKILMVLQNRNDTKTGLALFSTGTNGCQSYLSDYSENLLYPGCSNKDIMATYKTSKHKDIEITFSTWSILESVIFAKNDINQIVVNSIQWDWERKEIKELTVADIEKIVGCKVKIVKES